MSSVLVEEILAKFLEPNNESARTGKAELKEAMNLPTICPTLLHIGKNSTSPRIRQYALFFLRKRLSKFEHWDQLTVYVKHGIKSGLLDALTQETDVSLCNATAQVVASIANHELFNGKWPELLEFIQQLCCEAKEKEKKLGFYILSIVADSASEELKIFLMRFAVDIFHSALRDSDTISACYACVAFKKLIPCIGTDQATMIQPLIPKILIVVRNAIIIDGAKTMSCITENLMEIWEELLMGRTAILAPHLIAVIELCLEIASKKELNDLIRTKALSCIATLARLEKKSMIENKLNSSILQTLFDVMTEKKEEDYDEESSKPCIVAGKTLNKMALHLPPDKVITSLLQWADPVFKGSDIRAQQAGYTALAAVAEGCAEHIRTKYMAQFVQVICSGIKHPQAHVRNAAQRAVGEFCEHLQPDIEKYAIDILPILFDNWSATVISLTSAGKKGSRSVYSVFYAVTTFCLAMRDKLNPFVAALMENLLTALNPTYPLELKMFALFGIGITALAVKKTMVPYLGRIMENLKIYLSGQLTEKETPLEINALDTLALIALTIGEETFRPFADECLNLTIKLVQSKDDPNLRKSAYEVFTKLARVMKEDTAAALPVIIPFLTKTIESNNKGVMAATTDDDESPLDSEDECDVVCDTVENAYLQKKKKAYLQEKENAYLQQKENAYLEEKMEACLALSELALQARGSFTSYVEQCINPVYKLVDCGPYCNVQNNYNSHEGIYSAALSALTQFTICICKQSNGEQACLAALSILIPKLSEAIRTDRRFEVVSGALDCLTDLLKELKGVGIKSEAHLDTVFTCMKNIFNKATQCQLMERAKVGDNEETDTEDLDSEACVELLEDSGDVLAAFGNAMTPQKFAPYFAELLPVILHSAREHCKIAEKSVSASVLAKCMEPLDGVLEEFVPDLFTTFTNLVRDSDSEVRTNSVFGLGELVLHGRELLFPNFPQILQILSDALSRETNPLALDNICVAFTRMIILNISAIPMDQVFPLLMSHLPLRENFQQNSSVLKCLRFLFSNGHPVSASHLPQVMNVIFTMATQQELQPEQKPMIKELMALIASGFPDLRYDLPAGVLQKLIEVLA